MSYLEQARRILAELPEESPEPGVLEHVDHDCLDDGPVLEARHDLVAVRLHSKLLQRELWIYRDARAAEEIAAEFPGMPALTFDEIPHLRGKPPELLDAILNAKAEFRGARLCS